MISLRYAETRKVKKERVTDITTVLDLKAFYFLEQVIPDMKRELPAYLAAAEDVSPNILKYWNGGISRKNYHIGKQPASKSCCASHHPQLLKVFLVC